MKSSIKNRIRCCGIIFLVLLVVIPFLSYPQGKEANIWYFGFKAGIDFNAGSPPATLTDSEMTCSSYDGSASIADSMGNLLFYTNGRNIWNKNHLLMVNGDNFGNTSTQGGIIIPKDNTLGLYYVFNIGWDNPNWEYIFQYSIIDMNLDNGNGAVVNDFKGLPLTENNSFQLSAVVHANYNDFWVVTHGYNNNFYYSFLVTPDSIYPPVISYVGTAILGGPGGYMKISPNGKKIAIAVDGGSGNEFFELLDFDNETGEVSDINLVHDDWPYKGVEFSPDNTKLYVNGANRLNQYDLEAGSPQQILDSEVNIASSGDGGLQLGPDGKIYCVVPGNGHEHYLSTINEPNIKAPACDFQWDAVYLGGYPHVATHGLPSFIQSYLNDPVFNWQHTCLGDSTQFTIEDVNGIDSVYWDFDDFTTYPNNTSTLFSPSHVFSHADTFNVSLTVYSGLIEKTVTQQVIIYPTPQPFIGNDTLMCNIAFILELDANCNAASYFWNTWATTQEITVSDTGIYWVRATSDAGCVNTDSIYIGLNPPPLLDETNLIITPTGCGMANGSITGLQVTGTPPLSYYWLNVVGDTISNVLDLINLSAGDYTLFVTDGNGCTNTLNNYIVTDNGSLQVDSVNFTNDNCNSAQASITVYTDSPNTDSLYFFLNGDSLQNNGLFTGLLPGSYNIMVKDTNGCIGIYANNPVIIDNIAGVQVINTQTTPEEDYQSNGSINITAQLTSGDINYSIYNGNNPQINNGLFEGLSAGTYTCMIWDEFGCDTIFDVIVPRNTTTILEAISGFGNSCVGDTAVSSLKLDQFDDVYYFETRIYYDINVVNCVGYIELLADLEDGFNAVIIPDLGEVHISWQGNNPLTLPIQTQMLKLVFGGLGEGISPVYWEAGPEESVFFNQNMDTIVAVCYVGDVQIYSRPEIQMQPYMEACAGDSIRITPDVTGGNGDIGYYWLGPDGYSSVSNELELIPANLNNTGIYSLFVEDSMHCKQNKTIELNIIPSPEIAFSEHDTLWVEPGFILDAGSGAYSYVWNTGESSSTITIDSMGYYNVIVSSYEDCKSSDAVQILWGGEPFYLPNAFTPNGDGLNDTFGAIPKYDYVSKYHLSIYNRWGQMIFETTDINNGWDGTYQGSPCMMGAYIYRIVYEEFGNHTLGAKVVEGTTMLIR